MKHRLLAPLVLTLLLGACGGSPRTETFILPDDGLGNGNMQSPPFRVDTMYRLPEAFERADQWLGWSKEGDLVALFDYEAPSGRTVIRHLSYPYRQTGNTELVTSQYSRVGLTGDGAQLYAVAAGISKTLLTLYSLNGGEEDAIVQIAIEPGQFLQAAAWSDNGSYLGLLLASASGNDTAAVVMYETVAGSFQTYPVRGLPERDTLLNLSVSDNGIGVLLSTLRPGGPGKYNVLLGTVNGNEIRLDYTHPASMEQHTWIGPEQAVFVGTDGSLYLYDRRNGELFLLLEKVSGFALSRDKKKIAYSHYDQDMIYAGSIQGRNVLHNEPVYHGLVPVQMDWSRDNKRLFIRGHKFFSASQTAGTDWEDTQSIIVQFE